MGKTDLSSLRLTVEHDEDFIFISQVYSRLERRERDLEYEVVLDLLDKTFLKLSTISASRRNEAL